MNTELEANSLAQELISDIKGERLITPGIPELTRKSAAEGCVLLKNDGTLPLHGKKISVFGRCQVDTFFVGYGSGGDVHPPYQVSILDGLRACKELVINEELATVYEEWCHRKENVASSGKEWGKWPFHYPEMPLMDEMVKSAAEVSDTAVVIIGRAAGEDRENYLGEGSYYLTGEEKRMICLVTSLFEHTVLVLNCGNVIDMSWTQDYDFSAILMMWLGGMESGNALADILSGKENPSGKLTGTIAKYYENYPSGEGFGHPDFNNYEEDIYVGYRYFETFAKDKILYSFGYGLSYTTFETEPLTCSGTKDDFTLTVLVKNTGERSGREVVQLYVEAVQGMLGQPKRRLIDFKKTEELAPGKEQELTFVINYERLASYDDTGKTGCKSAYVMEPGQYWFFFAVSGDDGKLKYRNAGGADQRELRVFRQLQPICPVQSELNRLVPVLRENKLVPEYEQVPYGDINIRERILANLPQEIPYTGDVGIKFDEVINGTASLEAFIAQLTDEELEALTRGEGGTDQPCGVEGNVGDYGGFLPSLKEKGVPAIITADGPAGIRIKRYSSLLPCGTALACTWNEELVEQLFTCISEELNRFEVDVFLAPGLNIHRNPLCGRNFEYFSEEPYVSGKMAAAAVRGIQAKGPAACPKHFAANNQEFRRNKNDSRVSERALREIYLKGFEICVKEGKPKNIMTSYNKINGVYSHYNYDLATTVLRDEWGYEGVVITDWWMQKQPSPEFPAIRDNAYRVRAGVDVLMPGNESHADVKHYVSDGTLLETVGKEDGITRAELQRTAITVLKFAAERCNNQKI